MWVAPNGFLLLSFAFGLQYGLEDESFILLLLPDLFLLLAHPLLFLLELDSLLIQASAKVHLIGS